VKLIQNSPSAAPLVISLFLSFSGTRFQHSEYSHQLPVQENFPQVLRSRINLCAHRVRDGES